MTHKGSYFFRHGDDIVLLDITYEDGEASASVRKVRPATDEEKGVRKRRKRVVHKVGKKKGCGGPRVKINRWLGCRWVGRPWPLRRPRPGLSRHFPWLLRPTIDEPGCGCLVRPKKVMLGLRSAGVALVKG